MKEKRIRIMIADDHQLVRETWRLVLERSDLVEIVGECDNGDQAIYLALTLKPDIILMDINMYPVNGFDATRKILEQSPEQKIIGISVNDQPVYVKTMLKIGAKGFVQKNCTPKEMLTAIESVAEGGTYIPDELRGSLN
jgi:DNA-binding NarL/FixJ family response regulator